MKRFFNTHALLAACVFVLFLATTQAIAQTADPADPSAPVPPATYRNALQSFRAVSDAPVGDWKAANAQVSKAGKTASTADTHAGHQHGNTEAAGAAQQTPTGHEAHDAANCMDHMKHKGMHKPMMSMGKGKHDCHHQEQNGKAGSMRCQHDMKHGGDHE